MKKNLCILLLAACSLFATACQDELKREIENLKDDVTALEERVAKLNESLASLSDLVTAVEQNDHIASVYKYPEGTRYACRITFTSGATLTLHNGTNGVSPIVGVRYNEQYGAYYWTIQMGPSGTPTWMTNSYGLRVRASGTVPQVKIEDGIWWYSFDGSSWNKCNWAPAQGEAGSSVFQSIDTSDPLYVVFTLADGNVIQIATQEAFDQLSAQCKELSDQFKTYTELVENLDDSCFVKSVSAFEEGEDSGYRITLEDGSVLTVRNGRDSRDSLLLTARAYTDGKYYWAWRNNSDEEYSWLYYNGEMVCVTMEDVSPTIGITDSLGLLYFTVTVGGQTEFMRDKDGNPAVATGRIEFDLIQAVDLSDPNTVVLTLSDGTRVSLPLTRDHTPALVFSYAQPGVEGSKSYTYQLMAFLTDTVGFACSNYAAYLDGAGLSIEAVSVDGDCVVENPTATNFSCTDLGKGRYACEAILPIPFTTGSSNSWDPTRPLRIALFLTWGDNTIMKVASFERIIHATGLYIPSTLALTVGGTATLKATMSPYNTTDTVKWSSGDPSIATVTEDGVVKGIAAGTCILTATTGYLTMTCTCTVS